MLGAIFGPALASAVVSSPVAADEALVYVPVAPCKIFAGVSLDGADQNDIETVDVTLVAPGTQNADVCAQTAAPAVAVAATLNVIAQSATARGNLQLGPGGGNTESVVNFVNTVDMNNSNELTVELDSGGQVSMQLGGSATNGLTDVATAKGVLLGYWIPGDSVYESFDRTIVVGGSGTNAQNGAELLAAVAAANAQSPSNLDPWLIKLEPGTFDIGNSTVVLGDGVLLEGSGSGFVVGSKILSVAVAINATGDTSISHVQADSSNTTGLLVTAGAQVDINNVDMRGRTGILVQSSASLTGSNVEAAGENGDGLNTAGSTFISNASITLLDGDAVLDHLGGTLEITQVRLTAFGSNNSGLFTNSGTTTEMRYVSITVPDTGHAIDGSGADICEALHLRQAGVATFVGAGSCPAA